MEIVGTNKNRFGHIVRAFSGCPNVTVYINNKRLAYAKGLMQSCPQKPNKVIAIECGIVNIITFTRLFHKYYGMTPSDYRNILAMQS